MSLGLQLNSAVSPRLKMAFRTKEKVKFPQDPLQQN